MHERVDDRADGGFALDVPPGFTPADEGLDAPDEELRVDRIAMEAHGVAVAPWSFAVPLEPALEEISVFRRQGRLVLA